MQTLLRPHFESTIVRVRAAPVVLAVQDTTTLSYTAHPPEGVGPVNTRQDQAVGLLLHETMAFSPDGTPLGLLNVQCWARDPAAAGKKHRRHELPIEQKESAKWLVSYRTAAEVQQLCPATRLVSVGDREADIYELFAAALRQPAGPGLLVRSERTRNRKTAGEPLWDKLAALPVAGTLKLKLPRRGNRAARTAVLRIRYAKVELAPPAGSSLPPVSVYAIYARETTAVAPPGNGIEWMLLTTVPTTSFADACERLRWYGCRWGIEVYHRTLKSGCRIEDRLLQKAGPLQACLAVDMVVAWRVHWLTMAGRHTPDASCRDTLSEDEWLVLGAWATGTRPAQPPTARQALHWLGRLGGWLQRGAADNPGTTCVWRGLQRLSAMADGFRIALVPHGVRDGPKKR